MKKRLLILLSVWKMGRIQKPVHELDIGKGEVEFGDLNILGNLLVIMQLGSVQ